MCKLLYVIAARWKEYSNDAIRNAPRLAVLAAGLTKGVSLGDHH